MYIIEHLINYLGVLFCHFVIYQGYKNFINSFDSKLNLKNFLLLIIFSLLSYLNAIFNYTFSKIIIHFLIIALMNYSIFKSNFFKTIIITAFEYFILLLSEIFCALFIIALPIENIEDLDNAIIYKNLMSFLISLITLLILNLKHTKKIILKILKLFELKYKIYLYFFWIVIVLILSMITFKNALNFNSITYYIMNLFTVLIFVIVILIMFFQVLKTKKAEEKEEILLDFIKKYEYIIDKDRVNRHEWVNNLLVLKSIKNKESKEYTETLNKFISTYQTSDTGIVRNIYNLPSGLKGILYYKIYDMKNNGIDILTNISTRAVSKLDNVNQDLFVKICKITGILLDNALEASVVSKEKQIVIDIYEENSEIFIYIENSIKGKVNIEKINNKNYSTKGKNRGLGLHLVNKIIKEQKELELEQKQENNKFVSVLKIK